MWRQVRHPRSLLLWDLRCDHSRLQGHVSRFLCVYAKFVKHRNLQASDKTKGPGRKIVYNIKFVVTTGIYDMWFVPHIRWVWESLHLQYWMDLWSLSIFFCELVLGRPMASWIQARLAPWQTSWQQLGIGQCQCLKLPKCLFVAVPAEIGLVWHWPEAMTRTWKIEGRRALWAKDTMTGY